MPFHPNFGLIPTFARARREFANRLFCTDLGQVAHGVSGEGMKREPLRAFKEVLS